MEQAVEPTVETKPETKLVKVALPGYQEAWQMVESQLRMEMRRVTYETWVQSLQPLSFKEGLFRLGAQNSYARDWVESHLRSRIARLLEGVFNQPVTVEFVLTYGHQETVAPTLSLEDVEAPPAHAASKERKKRQSTVKSNQPGEEGGGSPRKIQLQRAYGTERARIIQPERGMFLTRYFFDNWQPLLGHSAAAAVIAARFMCYWNPMTGELRNVVETDMGELARRASVSVRTVKDVLNSELIKRYFLRYKVRRVMTPNGVRTAGIILQVRMDDPLTPEDQDQHNLPEEEHWYTVDFEDDDA